MSVEIFSSSICKSASLSRPTVVPPLDRLAEAIRQTLSVFPLINTMR